MPTERKCSEGVKLGSTWVQLRICQTCSATLCCDSSPNKHASKHAREQEHPLIASAEQGDRWLYCYEHDCTAAY